MKKSTIVTFAIGLAAGVIFSDRIRGEIRKVGAKLSEKAASKFSEKAAQILHKKIDQVFSQTTKEGPRIEEDEIDVIWTATDLYEADSVLNQLRRLILKYGCASVSDLYDLIGESRNYTDAFYGWRGWELDVPIYASGNGEYQVVMPKAKRLG